MDNIINNLKQERNYSIFNYHLHLYTNGTIYNVSELDKLLKDAYSFMNDNKNSTFLENISKDSVKYIHFYDYVGVLFYLESNYKEALSKFEKSSDFKRKLLDKKYIKMDAYRIMILNTIYNLVEVYDVFQVNEKENLSKINKEISESKPKTPEDKVFYYYYLILTEFLMKPNESSIKYLESFKEDNELKDKNLAKFYKFKKYCLCAKFYEKIDSKKALSYFHTIVKMFETGELKKGEGFIKASIQCADYLILSNSKNANQIDFSLLKNFLINGLKYVEEVRGRSIINELKLAKYKVCILNKLIYLEILEKNPIYSRQYIQDIDDIFENNKIENATNMKIIYLNNKLIAMDGLLNSEECQKTIEDFQYWLQIDLGPPYKNITILNNICSYSRINGYFDDIKRLLYKLSPEERKAILNKNIPNMITYNNNMFAENTDIITEEIKMIKILKKLENIEDFRINNFDELYAANFLYNYLVIVEQNTNIDLGLINNIKYFMKEDILNVLYRSSASSSDFIIKNNLELYMNIVYMYSLNKYSNKRYDEAQDAMNQAIYLLDKSNNYNTNYKILFIYSDMHKLLGDCYFVTKKFEMSLNNYKKAHEIYEKLNVPREMSIVSFNIGLISLYHLKDEREAVKHLESAIKGFKEKNDEKRVKKAEELLSIVNKKE
jgi:hypothetical protein